MTWRVALMYGNSGFAGHRAGNATTVHHCQRAAITRGNCCALSASDDEAAGREADRATRRAPYAEYGASRQTASRRGTGW